MVWNKTNILSALRKLHKSGADLSYNALAKQNQSLVSAAAYHFSSYRKAVEKSGIDYASVTCRPRWDRASIIRIVKAAKRNGEDLHWSAVTQRRDELGRAAFAALQPRLFGNWERALTASGLDADEISRYRRWNKDSIVFELRCRFREHEPLNSGALQSEDPGLHAAAVRHFGNYDAALRAARVDPLRVAGAGRGTRQPSSRRSRPSDAMGRICRIRLYATNILLSTARPFAFSEALRSRATARGSF